MMEHERFFLVHGLSYFWMVAGEVKRWMRHIAGWKFSIRCVTESLRRQENFRKNFRFLSARYKTTFWRYPSIILYTRSREEVVGFLCRNIISLISIRLHRRSCIFFVKCMRNLLADERKSCAGSYESTDRISWNFESFLLQHWCKKGQAKPKKDSDSTGLICYNYYMERR